MSDREQSTSGQQQRLLAAFEANRPRLRAMLTRRIDPALLARTDPDDVLSETFLQAQRRWNNFEQGRMTDYSWLYRIALDCLIEAWRRETRGKRDLRRELPWPEKSSMQLCLKLASPDSSPSNAVARGELKQRIARMLELLDERDREILWLRHFDQLPFKEAAEIIGITEANASVRYGRAMRRFKKLWQATSD